MTDNEIREEYTKCAESLAYFYNNYCLVVDKTSGKHVKPNPVTDAQIEELIKIAIGYCRLKRRRMVDRRRNQV